MKFSALNVDLSSPSPNPLLSRWVAQAGIKEGYPSKSGYLPVVGLSACKWLQIGTDMLLIITNTDDKLFRKVSIDDLK